MKYFITVASLVASAFAVNSFTAPLGNTPLYAGQGTVIAWNNTGGGSNIDLILKQGTADDLSTIVTIGNNIPNDGKAEWVIPTNIPTGEYALEIVEVDSSGSPITDTVNYTPQFQIINNSTTTSSTAAPSTTSSNSSTPVSTSTSVANTTTSSTVVSSTQSSSNVSTSSVVSSSAASSASSTSAAASSTGKPNGATTLQYSSLVAGVAAIGAAFFAF
jgi:hypothetical protein